MALESVGGKYEGVWINKLKNGDISYYINYRDENSKPIKKLVGKKTKASDFSVKDAYTKLIEVKYQLQHNQIPTIKNSRTNKLKFNDIWIEFQKYARTNKKSYLMDERNYNKHISPIFGDKDVTKLTSLDFEGFKQSLLEKGLEAQTVKHQLTLARTIINYAIKHDILKNYTNPLSNGKVKMPEIDNKRLAFLTKDQAKELLEILKDIHPLSYHLTVILLFTGARFSEVTGAASKKNKTGEDTALTWDNVNFETNTIYFKKTKDGNDRHIAMNHTLLETMRYLHQNKVNNNVITNTAGGIILKMPKHFMNVLELIIPGNKEKPSKYKITTHSLRHTHASWLAQAGLDILQIKEQLGHKNIDMTMRYAHLIPNKRHNITQNLLYMPFNN